MRTLVRAFFKALRVLLGPVMLLWEFIARPRGLKREPELQKAIDQQCQDLALYQFSTCPFCINVRQEMRRLSLNIEKLDAQRDLTHREKLLQGGGAIKVPCLKISGTDQQTLWLYESGAIIAYLNKRFAPG